MAGLRTRGQPAAAAAVQSMIVRGAPHALLLAGPSSVGKTTLALDLAAGLLCRAEDPADRPCWSCRACRQVDSGNHPDLHRLAPEGPGAGIGIGQVRALATELALLPVEGGARVAIVESAHRLTEDAQNALLKTLEEPPAGVTIILCASDEERLLPTVRSRVARLRLGALGIRDIEALLAEAGLADPPLAARLARLANGRPGLAVAYAKAPEAVAARDEIGRVLLDLTVAGRAKRLAAVRQLLARSSEAVDALTRATSPVGEDAAARSPRTARGRGSPRATATAPVAGEPDPASSSGETADADEPTPAAKATALDRRRAAAWLIDAWRDLSRDLAIAVLGDRRRVRDTGLLDELVPIAARLDPTQPALFLERLARAAQELDVNVSPELELDVLVLAWPRLADAA